MAYTVKYTDFANKGAITVNDSTVNTETSLSLPGRNQRGYGIAIAENFLHMLENFANATAPTNPVEGQVWYDTTAGVEDLKVFDGTTWKLAGSIRKSSNTPEVGVLGDLWVDTDNQQLFLFNGASWVLVGPTFSSGLRTGVVAETLVDSNDLERVVLLTYIDDQIVSIYSVDTFIPKVAIEGFDVIKSGINISVKDFNNDGVVDTKFWGTAEKAENLIIGTEVVTSSNFLRKDTSNTTNFGFTVRNDTGISTGRESQLRLSVDSGQIGNIYHSTPDSAFDIRINYNGATTTLLRADAKGNIGVGINNLSPAYTFDVSGTARVTDITRIESTQNTIDDITGALRVSGGVNIQKDIIVRGSGAFNQGLVLGYGIGGTSALPYETSVLTPRQNNIFNIGTSTLKFKNVYASTFYGDIVGNIVGNVTGNVNGPSTRLLSSTSFSIIGDVTASGFSFDGGTTLVSAGSFVIGQQYKIVSLGISGNTTDFTSIGSAANTIGLIFTATGVGTGTGTATTVDEKVFNASISPNFIDGKPQVTTPNGADALLVYRSGTGLAKIYRTDFFKNIATIPTGTILPFAGAVEKVPVGYLLCDGSEKSRAAYFELFDVIGYTYGNPASLVGRETFRLPDLRGRFPMGNSSMDNNDTITRALDGNVVDSNTQTLSGSTLPTAGTLGNTDGNDRITLDVNNLPAHQHNFVGDDDTIFYAVNNETTIPNDTGSSLGPGGTQSNSAQYINTTGDTLGATSNPFNIINPFLTINYIIFTGKFE